MKCLIVIQGETFRSGGPLSRERSASFDAAVRQKVASDSHIKMCETLQNAGCDCDIFLNTYNLNEEFDRLITQIYGRHLRYLCFNPNIMPSEEVLMWYTVQKMKEIPTFDYDFVIFTRPDLYVKNHFLKVLSPTNQKMMYSHVDTNFAHDWVDANIKYFSSLSDVDVDFRVFHDEIPPIGHAIIQVPQRFFEHIFNLDFWDRHASAKKFSRFVDPKKDIGLFAETFHWGTSCMGWNPLYSMVDRDEISETNSPSVAYLFDRGEFVSSHHLSSLYGTLSQNDTFSKMLQKEIIFQSIN